MTRIILGFLAAVALPTAALAGPLFDPFLERFQVGTYADALEVALDRGFPADLLEPIQVDSVWVGAAVRVLEDPRATGAPWLTRRLAEHLMPPDRAAKWYADQLAVVRSLGGTPLSGRTDWFLADRLALLAFNLIVAGDHQGAAALCRRLRDTGSQLGLTPREILVWDLRVRMLDGRQEPSTDRAPAIWEHMLPLGPFDAGNAWAVWAAHCRDLGADPLPPVQEPEVLGKFLGGLGRHWIEPAQLYGSTLPDDYKAALGALMFRRTDLARHFELYPAPPAAFDLQGWWVRGMRMHLKGQAGPYEELAARPDLDPGWSMDVLRRASEVRLLKDQWPAGLANLDRALALAGADEGTRSLRRRLRQWTEQALVLALAKGDVAGARAIAELGRRHLKDRQLADFEREIGHWLPLLAGEPPSDAPAADGPRAAGQTLVETGRAPDLAPADSLLVGAFLEASERSLWELWYRWGLTLADPAAVTGIKRDRAILYRDALRAGSTAAAREDSALAIVALRFRGRPEADILLRQALDRDVGRVSDWAVAPDPSPIPGLAARLKGSELDRHALLGFALAAGDMRGILAVAVVLEGRGLSAAEKMRFQYPLPQDGPIRNAIAAAGSPPALLLAVARNESLFEPSVRSRAGALGWMQIMPFHYQDRGARPGANNWRCPGVSITRGDGLLVENRRRYGGDPYLAVAAYNAGPQAASRWREQLGGDPTRDVYLAWIGYPETRHYVEKVLIDRHIYDWIIAGKDSP